LEGDLTITVGAFEAKTKLSELLDKVEAGEEVIITRRGKEVARLVASVADRGNRSKVMAAEIMAISNRAGAHLRKQGIVANSLDHGDMLYDETGLPK
jgi:prevent-host-death family protein